MLAARQHVYHLQCLKKFKPIPIISFGVHRLGATMVALLLLLEKNAGSAKK